MIYCKFSNKINDTKNMFVQNTIFMCILSSIISEGYGYASGAGSNACNTLRPGGSHGSPQTGPSPYNVQVLNNENNTYTHGTKVSVEVSTSGDAFQGLFLQARRDDGGGVVGLWDSPSSSTNTRTMRCSTNGDTITHANTNAKTTVTLSWNPPSNDVGSISFTGVVSKQKTVWWNNQKSSALAYQAGANNNNNPTDDGDETDPNNASTFGLSGLMIVNVFSAVVIWKFLILE